MKGKTHHTCFVREPKILPHPWSLGIQLICIIFIYEILAMIQPRNELASSCYIIFV